MKALIALFFVFLSPAWASQEPDKCIVRLAALDIGSGSTKMKVADVDVCKQRVKEILDNRDAKVSYKDSIKNTNVFSPDIMVEGLAILRSLKFRAEKFQPKAYVGVATSAFREAKNADDLIKKMKTDVGIDVHVISQKKEAELGFYSASSVAGLSPKDVVVWDIGGGSQQMSAMDESGSGFLIYEGDVASVGFRDLIISKVQKKEEKSPNPISEKDSAKALELAQKIASSSVSPALKKKILKKDTSILGIGGVHALSVKKQINLDGSLIEKYNQEILAKTLKKRLGLTDLQIGGKYADTEVSNLILVLGFMKALGIEQVHALDINLADGLLIQPAYWQEGVFPK